jgi:hypothetical protein
MAENVGLSLLVTFLLLLQRSLFRFYFIQRVNAHSHFDPFLSSLTCPKKLQGSRIESFLTYHSATLGLPSSSLLSSACIRRLRSLQKFSLIGWRSLGYLFVLFLVPIGKGHNTWKAPMLDLPARDSNMFPPQPPPVLQPYTQHFLLLSNTTVSLESYAEDGFDLIEHNTLFYERCESL